MDDQDASDSPTPGDSDRPTAIARVRQIAHRGRRKVAHSLRSRLESVGEKVSAQLVDLMASPRQVEALQKSLVRITGWTLRRGFQADPNAELLFEFIEWLEKRHSREKITTILLHSQWLRDPAFVDALVHLSRLLSPFETDIEEQWSESRLEAFKTRAGRRLLELLVDLAALEQDVAPSPSSTVTEQIAFFRSPPIPDHFHRLADMTQGRHLLTRTRTSERRKLAKKVARRLGVLRPNDSNLIPFIPGIGDETLHFLVFSTTFFLQSYLVRNLVEALPELADEFSENLKEQDDDIIDLDP